MTPEYQALLNEARRDAFATAALQGMTACQDFVNELITSERHTSKEMTCASIARWAYKYADAMMAERSKANGQA